MTKTIIKNEETSITEGIKLAYLLLGYFGKLNHLHLEIQEISKKFPTKIAVTYREINISFKELEEKSNQVANSLLNTNLQLEDTVGIYLQESHLLPIAILGVLKAGGTYVPLSVDYPIKRVSQIANKANFKFLITASPIDCTDFVHKPAIIHLQQNFSSLHHVSKAHKFVAIKNNSAAYIMFTSGSTGTPKGVVIEQRSLSSYLEWYITDLQTKTQINLPLTSSICFAASITQLFSPLLLGKTLHILDRETVKNPEYLLNWYQNRKGFGLYCVPTLWEEIINHVQNSNNKFLKGPECVYLSGESFSKKLIDNTFTLWKTISIWNLYGPTEATANISATQIKKGDEIHIGKVIRGGTIFILDKDMNFVPKNTEGYLYISSRALARGYLNEPLLNKATFIKNHNLKGFENIQLYNTGDRAKINSKNQLIYLGRNDQQVKIRGYRIELAEIEKKISTLKIIRHVACKVVHKKKKEIAAFVVTKNETTSSKIKNDLKKILPSYMIPSQIIFLQQMPKLANGKINKKELTITYDRPKLAYKKTVPKNILEEKMLSIWENVLGIKNIGMNDEFFDLGGDSLKLIQLSHQIKKTFHKNIAINEVWDNSTPHKLLAILYKKEVLAQKKAKTNLLTLHKQDKPLTFNQSALWFIHQSKEDQTAYNMLFRMQLKAPINLTTLKQKLTNIIDENPILKSNFKIENKNPVRFIHYKSIDFTLIETSADTIKKVSKNYIKKCFSKRFDLENDNLIQFTTIKDTSNNCFLYVHVHHIIFDGISIKLFANELENNSKATNTVIDYTVFEKKWKNNYYSGHLENSYQFWQKKLRGANFSSQFPLDFNRPKTQSYQGKTKTLVLHTSIKLALDRLTKETKTTNFIVLLSIFKILIHKYTRNNDLLIGVPFANRMDFEAEKTIGFFTNTIVFRTLFTEKTTFLELLNNIKSYTKEALIHQSFPFDKLVKKINPERNPSANPIFQIMFAYHQTLNSEIDTHRTIKSIAEIQNPNCKFDLDLEAQEETDKLYVHFNYNISLFSSKTIKVLMQQYKNIIEQVILNSECVVADISLFSKPLKNKTFDINIGESVKVKHQFLHKYLENQAEKTPKKLAVTFNNNTLTYNELNTKSNQFAHYLKNNGVTNNSLIGIISERSINMLVYLFGILKAGAAYMPLDNNQPIKRIKTIIKESNAPFIIDCHNKLKTASNTIIIQPKKNNWEKYATTNLALKMNEADAAYTIYTSGTSGTPKGVVISHKAIVNRIDWMQNAYPIDYKDTLIQKTNFTFDVSVWELFWWCVNGSSLHILDIHEEKNPAIIFQKIIKEKITVIHFVPSMFTVFLEYLDSISKEMKSEMKLTYIFTSGESLKKHHTDLFNSLQLPTQLINLYGPTEAAVDVTYFNTEDAVKSRKISIGKPIQNTGIHILDTKNRENPINIPGELAISGVGLAKGYLHQKKITDAVFVTSPQSGKRLYKTGDLARLLPNKTIEFLGRLDSLVKIRGYRIETGEIENHLLKHPNIKNAVVLCKKLDDNDKRLVAYIVLRKKNNTTDLIKYLKTLVPDYMIPSSFIMIDSIPTTYSGKLNQKKLPEPFQIDKNTSKTKIFKTTYEMKLAEIWKDVLKTDNFNLQDNFYDVGGHSLLLISMKSKIDKNFNVTISILDLFQHTTIASLSEVLETTEKKKNKSIISSRAALQRNAIAKLKNKRL